MIPGVGALTQDTLWCFSQVKGTIEIGATEADIISTVEFNHTGELLATGDKGGRVVIFQREQESKNQVHRRGEYNVYSTFQSHEPEFDYLKSLEIEEKINKIRWLPQQNAAYFLLSTNDKTVKLWKVSERDKRPEGYNLKDEEGRLRDPATITTLRVPVLRPMDLMVEATPRRVFANAHTYHINSISVNSDYETYMSADDLRINLWNFEITNQSFSILSLGPIADWLESGVFRILKWPVWTAWTTGMRDMIFIVPVLRPMDLMVEATPRRVFANAHTYHINSISVNSDYETYMSADDLRINLWNFEITNQSFSILSLGPIADWLESGVFRYMKPNYLLIAIRHAHTIDVSADLLRCTSPFVQLLQQRPRAPASQENKFNLTSRLTFHIDFLHPPQTPAFRRPPRFSRGVQTELRQFISVQNEKQHWLSEMSSEKEAGPNALESAAKDVLNSSCFCSTVFEEPEDPSNRSFFSEIISSISDVKFSHSGRYIMTRDYLTVKVWDLNMENRPIETYQVHDYLRSKLCSLYENDCIFDKFECVWNGSDSVIMTGSYNNFFRMFDRNTKRDVTLEASRENSKPRAILKPRKVCVGGKRRKDEISVDSLDFSKKILHTAWHPSENIIAVAATNNLYIFQDKVN
ncbi:serine/threonine-protein phosphatase 2A 55 kDa regulatory subunit B beta isoform [Pteropus vampyrus]|uniref:Serine/threonine-protein phosphatase 2A 55 kDa regulatory subunit B n=1 Tax=Pteropus vampyrus TaxID=132908 RepID=A0A6P6CTD3_PTEVA|nr:serine/threonine-protein phosphatase 2A 55 kDa regulatory subunit B beta isoform [Pteropus vampyrus]